MSVTNAITDTIAVTYSGNGKAVSTPVGSYTGTEAVAVETVITAATVKQAITLTFPVASIKCLIVSSDQDVTLYTNSSTTPIDTLAVKAAFGLFWTKDTATVCPFTADVTHFYVTNAGATDAKFHFRVLN
jgi:hypothetical protein